MVAVVLCVICSRSLARTNRPVVRSRLSNALGYGVIVITMVCLITAFKYNPIPLHYAESTNTCQIKSGGMWKTVDVTEFELVARQNLRRDLAFAMFYAMLSTLMIIPVLRSYESTNSNEV